MVKYSDDTDYEQIDLAAMHELRDARLVLAQIVTIDRVNNCAEITIEEDCAALTDKDLSAVPFFYHCEDSTGTLEDLKRGHKAFIIGEYVYCLWSPEIGDLAERFYIIGHADIRGIHTCKPLEIIFLTTQMFTSAFFTGQFYGLVNAQTGMLLDLDAFENIDTSSPPKPSAAMGVASTEFYSWLTYNFRSSVAPTSVMVGPSQETPTESMTYAVWSPDGTATNVNYTGRGGYISSSNPVDCDAWHYPGNDVASIDAAARGVSWPDGQLVEEQRYTESCSDSFGSHGSFSPNNCRAYMGASSLTQSSRQYSEKTVVGNNYIELYDNVEATSYYIICWTDVTKTYEYTASLSTSGNYYAEETYRYQYKMNFDFLSLSRPAREVELSVENSQTYTAGWSEVDYSTTLSPITTTGSIAELVEGGYPCFYDTANANIVAVGETGIFIIAYAAVVHTVVDSDASLPEGSVRPWGGGWTVPLGISLSGNYPAGAVRPSCWGAGFGSIRNNLSHQDTPKSLKVATCALACAYSDTFGVTANTTIGQCLQNYQSSISTNLANSVDGFYDYVGAQIRLAASIDQAYIDAEWGYFTSVIAYGPRFNTLVRKSDS